MTTHDVEIAIVGAGFSGLGAAIKLAQRGIDDYVILDRGSDFGGTWRDNTYPGAACDVRRTCTRTRSHRIPSGRAPTPISRRSTATSTPSPTSTAYARRHDSAPRSPKPLG